MTSIPARLTAITLGTRDVPAARAFYRRLGWSELPLSDDGFVAFLLGGVLLTLYPLAELVAEAAPGEDDVGAVGFRGVTLACNVDTAEQVDDVFAAFVDAGATVVAEPTAREWGGRSAYVADPEGNRWEIAWASTLQLDERGAVQAFG